MTRVSKALAGCGWLLLGWTLGCAADAAESEAGGTAGGSAGVNAGVTAGQSGLPVAGMAAPEAGAAAGATAGTGGQSGVSGLSGMGAGAGAGVTAGAEAGAGGAGEGSIEPEDFDYMGQDVALAESLVIAAGETLRVGPGTRFTASGATVRVQILGTLIASGSADAPVEFLGAGVPRSWHGIVIGSGGRLEMAHAKIGGATYGIHAEAGSSFAVERTEIGTSFKVAVLFADGSFDACKFHASGDHTFSPVNEVAVDDVNGSMTIIDASPTITHSSFDNSSPLVDMIRIGGNASPVFDHVSVVGAHCGFHTNGGVNSAPTIRNSVLQGMSYAVMAYAAKPNFEGNNFLGNSADIGFCFGATADNAPTLSNNFYSSGGAVFDPSCFEIGVPDPAPAATQHAAAGPMGL